LHRHRYHASASAPLPTFSLHSFLLNISFSFCLLVQVSLRLGHIFWFSYLVACIILMFTSFGLCHYSLLFLDTTTTILPLLYPLTAPLKFHAPRHIPYCTLHTAVDSCSPSFPLLLWVCTVPACLVLLLCLCFLTFFCILPGIQKCPLGYTHLCYHHTLTTCHYLCLVFLPSLLFPAISHCLLGCWGPFPQFHCLFRCALLPHTLDMDYMGHLLHIVPLWRA